MYSCTEKDYFDPNYTGGQKENPLDFEAPAGFDWSMITSTKVTVNVDDEYNGEFYYLIEILNANPFGTDTYKVLDAGTAKKDNPFVATIEYVKGLQQYVYIRETDPRKRVSVRRMTLDANEVVAQSLAYRTTAQTRVATNQVKSYNTDGATEITSNLVLEQNAKYIISNEYKGSLTTWKLNKDNKATVFVEGEWTYTPSSDMQNVNVIVLDGGKINADNITIGTAMTLTVQPGGNVNIYGDQLHMNQGSSLINNGTIYAKKFNINSGNGITLLNNTDARLKGESIIFTDGTFQNDGTISFDKIETNSGTFINNCQAFFDDECKIAGSVKVILNNGVIADELDDNEYSYESLDEFKCEGNGSVEMNGGSMIKAEKVTLQGSGVIKGTGLNNLLRCSGKVSVGGGTSIQGPLTMECSETDESGSGYISDNVKQYRPYKSKVSITACKGTDDPEENPNPPTNPEFPIEIVTSTDYIYAMEDQWPTYGDYDMNDVVVGISPKITKWLGQDSKRNVNKVEFKIRILAVGAGKKIAAALQLDNIDPDHIANVKYDGISVKKAQDVIGTSSFILRNNAVIEEGQDKAVIPLFENANDLMGGNFVNVGMSDNTRPFEYTIEVTFKGKDKDESPVKAEDLGHKALNFFIIPDLVKMQAKQRRPEIHLGGYNPTNLANPDLFGRYNDNGTKKYISKDNMVWGLVIPTDTWNCPQEAIQITDTYEYFKEWVTSGGKSHSDWYK